MSPSSNTPLSVQDWDELNKQYPSASMLKLVLQSFLKHHGNSSSDVRSLAHENNVEALSKLAHKLKGAACMMRATVMINLAEAVENQIHATGQIDQSQVQNLAAAMDIWVTELSQKQQTI